MKENPSHNIFGVSARVSPLLALRYAVASFFLLVSMSSCAEARISNSNVPLIEGPTDERMLIRLIQQIESGATTIRVRSFGGEEKTAIRIANLLHANQISLVVDGYCTSSCAQYLLAGAASIIVLDDALLSLHMNSYGLVDGGYVDGNAEEFANLKENAVLAEELYIATGKDPSFMLVATDASQLRCVRIQDGRPRGAIAAYEIWIPSKSIFEHYGFVISGDLPSSRSEAIAIANRLLKPDTTVWFGPILPSRVTRPLPDCASL